MNISGFQRWLVSSLAALCLLALSGPTRAADVSVNVRLPAPVITLPAPPHMVWLPRPSIYIAIDSPHQIFFRDDRYYLYDRDVWYVGPGYGGPWARTKIKRLPPGLRQYHREQWEELQREARPRYHDDDDHEHRNFVGWKDKKEKKAKKDKHGKNHREGRDSHGHDHHHDHGHGDRRADKDRGGRD